MARDPSPVFLERGSYRRRRVMDAVRLVVVLGAGLWMVPLLWPTANDPGVPAVSMSDALFFVFGVWVFLIAVSIGLVALLRQEPSSEDDEESKE